MEIQGTAADLIKVAMINVYRRLRQEKWRTRMLLQIHDELVFEAPPDELDGIAPVITEEMTQALADRLNQPSDERPVMVRARIAGARPARDRGENVAVPRHPAQHNGRGCSSVRSRLSRQIDQLVVGFGADYEDGAGARGDVVMPDIERGQQPGFPGIEVEGANHG